MCKTLSLVCGSLNLVCRQLSQGAVIPGDMPLLTALLDHAACAHVRHGWMFATANVPCCEGPAVPSGHCPLYPCSAGWLTCCGRSNTSSLVVTKTRNCQGILVLSMSALRLKSCQRTAEWAMHNASCSTACMTRAPCLQVLTYVCVLRCGCR